MKVLFLIFVALVPPTALAKQPLVGRKAAQKYFSRAPASDSEEVSGGRPAAQVSVNDHYLSLHFGGFVESESYASVRSGDARNVGKENLGVTYRLDDFGRSMDLLLRADLTWYEYNEGRSTKLSLIPLLVFPEAGARFPLYFGFGIGPGVYLRQISGESSMSLDYQLIAGVRLYDIFGSAGLTIETGLKNHFHLLGNGQFNGVFLALGTVFVF